jgi:dTDP-4-dehydrorhamnose reductase
VRIYLTGASGFVGSNLAHVFGHGHGAEVLAPGHEHVDLTDELVVRRSVLATRPDAIVHAHAGHRRRRHGESARGRAAWP